MDWQTRLQHISSAQGNLIVMRSLSQGCKVILHLCNHRAPGRGSQHTPGQPGVPAPPGSKIRSAGTILNAVAALHNVSNGASTLAKDRRSSRGCHRSQHRACPCSQHRACPPRLPFLRLVLSLSTDKARDENPASYSSRELKSKTQSSG